MALSDLVNPRPILQWKDGYGTSRTAAKMSSEHLWNVLGYLMDRAKLNTSWWVPGAAQKWLHRYTPFYFQAARELQKRGLLP